MSDYSKVWALMAGVTLLQLAGGVLGVIAPLGLQAMGVNAIAIGLIAGVHAAGFMAGAAIAPVAISSVGNIRVFAAAAASMAAGALLMDLAKDPLAWTLVRALQGAGFAWMFASVESWLSAATPPHRRGAVTSAYHVAAKAALMTGPFFVAGLSPLAHTPYVWCAFFAALCLIPVCMTRLEEPPRPATRPISIAALIRLTPAAVFAVFLAGVINTGLLALLPVFAERVFAADGAQGGTEAAAFAFAAAWTGGLLSQWPAGRLSDRIDRRLVVAALAILAGTAALILGLVAHHAPLEVVLALVAVWGAGSLSFYGIGVAHAVDRADPADIPSVMSGLLFVWAAGSVIGPLIFGAAIRWVGPQGLFLLAAALSAALTAGMLLRRNERAPAKADDREAWSIAQPTSVEAGEIDPRSDAV
ncbi:MAG: MFS transporter [Pseudomonadota bacterium]